MPIISAFVMWSAIETPCSDIVCEGLFKMHAYIINVLTVGSCYAIMLVLLRKHYFSNINYGRLVSLVISTPLCNSIKALCYLKDTERVQLKTAEKLVSELTSHIY